MRELQRDLNQEGGTFSAPLTQDQRARLSRIVELIDKGFSDFVAAQGRNGALQSRLDADRDRLNNRIDFLSAEVGQAADADLAEVAMRMSAVQTQYQAAARVFAQISELSVLNFLR
jgi:flagellin-like hook-associated protein FlgL